MEHTFNYYQNVNKDWGFWFLKKVSKGVLLSKRGGAIFGKNRSKIRRNASLSAFIYTDGFMACAVLYIIPPSLEIESKQAEFNVGQETINKP